MIIVVVVLMIASGLLWNSDNSGWPAIAVLIVILLGLINEMRNASRYWRMSMGED
jgi:hypothetical protein